MGLQTIARRKLTAKGIKPITPYQHKFDNFYLFGAFSPINGASLLLEMPFCNSSTFQIFLDELSAYKPREFKILILDNGAFHHAKSLQTPENIALIFLPPYSPELNPAERMWRFIKDRMAMTAFRSLEAMKMKLEAVVKTSVTKKLVKSVCNDDFYSSIFKTTFNV